jgi:hypothetical protein
MNYKPLIQDKVDEFFEENPTYTWGQLLYSMRGRLRKSRKNKDLDFLDMTDETFYQGIILAIQVERD